MIGSSSQNGPDDFNNLNEDIKDILNFAEDNQIFIINKISKTVELFSKDYDNDEFYTGIRRKLRGIEAKYPLHCELLLKLFDMVYFRLNNQEYLTFEDINLYYNNIFPTYQKQKQKQIRTNSFFIKNNDPDGESIPRPESPTDDFEEPFKNNLNKLSDLGIWISKKNRDHHKISKAFVEPNSELFQNLLNHYSDRDFNNPSHTAKLIKKDERALKFSMQLYKNGTVMIYHKSNTEQLEFLEDFFKEFNFLPELQQKDLLSSIMQKGNYCYILETANALGPDDKVKQYLKGSHVIIRKIFCADGTLGDIDVKVDYSCGGPEFEAKGKPGPTRKLISVIKDPTAMVEGLEKIEYDVNYLCDEIRFIIENENEIENSNIERHNEIKEILENIDISKLKEKISQINNSIISLDEKYRKMNIEQTEEIKNVIFENHEELVQGQNYLNENIVISKDEIKNEIKESTEKIISNNNYSQMSVLYQSAEHQAKNQQNFNKLENEIKESTEKIISNNNYSQMSVLYQSAEHQAKNQQNFNKLEQQISKNIDLTSELFPGIEIIEDEITTLKNEVREGSQKIIESFEEKLDLLDKKIDEKFDSQNQRFKNNLALILRLLHKNQGQTIELLQSHFDVKKTTLYKYLNVLQKENLVKSEKIIPLIKKPGRPKSKYYGWW